MTQTPVPETEGPRKGKGKKTKKPSYLKNKQAKAEAAAKAAAAAADAASVDDSSSAAPATALDSVTGALDAGPQGPSSAEALGGAPEGPSSTGALGGGLTGPTAGALGAGPQFPSFAAALDAGPRGPSFASLARPGITIATYSFPGTNFPGPPFSESPFASRVNMGPPIPSSSASGSFSSGLSATAAPFVAASDRPSTSGTSADPPSTTISASAGPSFAAQSSTGTLTGSAFAVPSLPGPSALASSSAASSSSALVKMPLSEYAQRTLEANKAASAQKVQAAKTFAMIRAHDEGRLNLWPSGLAHDIMMECGNFKWPVHHDILAREVPIFGEADRWPEDREGRVITCTMNSHDPVRLGYCLRFMYEKEYPMGDFDPEDPLSVNNIRQNCFMYNAGTSLAYQNLMDYAVRKLYKYGRLLAPELQRLPPAANHLPAGFVNELRITLSEQFDHPEYPTIFFAVRTAVASIMEHFLPWLRQHPGFCAAIKGDKVWDALLVKVEADIKEYRELGHVYEGMFA